MPEEEVRCHPMMAGGESIAQQCNRFHVVLDDAKAASWPTSVALLYRADHAVYYPIVVCDDCGCRLIGPYTQQCREAQLADAHRDLARVRARVDGLEAQERTSTQ